MVRKLFFFYFLIILILCGFFFVYSSELLKRRHVADLSAKLQRQAALAARLLSTTPRGIALDEAVKTIADELAVRVTVVRGDGEVVADSAESPATMDNHANHPEIRAAFSSGHGSSVRHSATVGYEMLYEAIRFGDGPEAWVLRLSAPLAEIKQTLASIRAALLAALLLASTLAVLAAYFFSRRLGKRIARISEFSRQVAALTCPQNFFAGGAPDELSALEQNLSRMSERLRDTIKKIVAEKEMVASILKCMVEALLVVDMRGQLLLLNENARRLFGLSEEQSLEGASLMEISRHPEMRRLLEEVLTCDCRSQCSTKEIALGDGKWFFVNAVSLRDGEERPLGYVLVFHDITEVKRLENVRADLVANVSHELRTPLTAIRGYAETLLRSPPADPADIQGFLEIIQHHSERLGRLIDDLLTLSDLESGKIRLANERLNVNDIVSRVLEIFYSQASAKGVSLTRSVDRNLPEVIGDSDRLQQLLINLIDNALKYTPAGGEVTVVASGSTSTNDGRGPRVQLSVADTGCGIPEKDLPRLTERFYRVDKARSRKLGGTGLGLAIVKHIVQAHRGTLAIESRVGKGTTVTVMLSAEKAV